MKFTSALLFYGLGCSQAAFLAPKSIATSRVLHREAKFPSSNKNVKSSFLQFKNENDEDDKTTTTISDGGKFNFSIPELPDMSDISSNLPFQNADTSTGQSVSSGTAITKLSNALANPSMSPAPYDLTDPSALISVTKSFIATDFGIQSERIPSYFTGPKKEDSKSDSSSSLAIRLATPVSTSGTDSTSVPFYGAALLADSFIWVSGNNLNDGRTGILNKNEYLAAGRFFNLRGSFPDLEYRPMDFRVYYDEAGEYDDTKKSKGVDGDNAVDAKEVTIRFTTLATGTFRGSPFQLRSKMIPPNGKIMKCSPTSVSITFSTDKSSEDYGKIIKLVSDMVMDRQVGNTNGLSGISAAAVIAGSPPGDLEIFPPLVALERFFGRPMTPIIIDEEDGNLPPFPSSVMIQLAKGVTASYFGIDDADLLANDFSYLDPLMGPLNKDKYLELFSTKYNIRDGIPNLDYQFQNYRVDSYNPYRVWVDTRPKGLRISDIGNAQLPKDVSSIMYEAPPEAMSFTFDNDGFCKRITGGAVLDPLLGNTGGLGGAYGALYATGNPVNPLKSRTSNVFWNRAQKRLFQSIGGVGADGYKLSDGRVVNASPGGSVTAGVTSLGSLSGPPKPLKSAQLVPKPPNSPKLPPKPTSGTSTSNESIPFFAQSKSTFTIPAVTSNSPKKASPTPPVASKPLPPKPPSVPPASKAALSSMFGATDATTASEPDEIKDVKTKTEQLREAARAARAEAAAAKERAEKVKRQQAEAAKKAAEAKKTPPADKESGEIISDETGGFGGVLSFPSMSSSKVTSLDTPAKESPDSSKSASAKRSPTFSLFGASKQSSSKPKTKSNASTKKSVKSPSASSTKRSPTLSVFASSSKKAASARAAMSKPVKKSSPTSSSIKKSPTFSVFGTSPTSKTTDLSSPKPTKPSPTFNIFGGVSKGSASTSASKMGTKASSPPKKSPTLNIFGGAPKGSTKEATAEPEKTTPSKSPTFNIFSTPKSAPIATAPSPSPKKSPTLSIFGGTSKASATPESSPTSGQKVKSQTTKTPTKNLKKSDPLAPPTSKPSTNYFGNFFGNSGTSGTNNAETKVANKKNLPKSKSGNKISSPPKGVPVLKQWKKNPDNSITGRIYLSGSFKNGTEITTSTIKGKVAGGGVVVQTKSGSKYFLE